MFDVEKFIALVEERPALYDPRVQEYSSREIKSRCWWEIGSMVCVNWDELNDREKYEKEKELMRKWKAIRDNFVKDIRHRKKSVNGESAPKRRRYIYYSAMQFLLPIIDSNDEDDKVLDKDKNPIRESRREMRNKVSAKQSNKIKHSIDAGIVGLNSDDNTISRKEETTALMGITTTAITTTTPNICNTTTSKNLTNALSQMQTLQNERTKDVFGNRAFLLSYLPIMDDLPSDLALDARLRITEVFKNICSTSTARKSMHSDSDLILPEALVELVDSPSDEVSLDMDLSN